MNQEPPSGEAQPPSDDRYAHPSTKAKVRFASAADLRAARRCEPELPPPQPWGEPVISWASRWLTGAAVIFTIASMLLILGIVAVVVETVRHGAVTRDNLILFGAFFWSLGLSMFLAGVSWRLRAD